MKTIKIFSIATCLLMVLMLAAPTFAVNGPLTQNLQYKFYGGQSALFMGLLNNEIDIMAWPVTYAEWQTVKNDPTITTAPYYDLGDYEIAFNNNATDSTITTYRKAMNYTDFRQAIACLIDKDSLISSSALNGFGTRIDTPIPRPIDNYWVNFNDSKYDANGNLINNYPWEFNETHALEILWNGGWYSHVTYPTLASLLATALPLATGSVIYPSGHPQAGNPVDALRLYVRSDHLPRKAAGEALNAELRRFGFNVNLQESGGVIHPFELIVSGNKDYDIATIGWSFSAQPLHFWTAYTPLGIYPYGPNPYMIQDSNMTYWAGQEYPYAANMTAAINAAMMCQDIIVKNAMFVPLYTARSYMVYRTGVVGAINFRGYGMESNLEYTFMNAKVAPYTAPMTIRYGTFNPPVQVNPIFSSWLWEYEVMDRIFNGPMATNPYKPTIPDKSPAGSDQPWMAYDWNFQLSNFTGWNNTIPFGGTIQDPWNTMPYVSYMNMANVTFWFRHDITWHDGTPFTVDDWNYTCYLTYTYGDSWWWSNMQFIVNFVKIDNWTCSLYFSVPSFWMTYDASVDIVPQHIYHFLVVPADAGSGSSTTGHHGYWPGADCNATEVLPNPYFTYSQLTSAGGEQYTWVGTGMWKYQVGSLAGAPGAYTGLTCVPYSGFWMSMVQGDIDLNYYWNAGPAPQGGSYKIGLADLVLLANAYGTVGKGSPTELPFKLGGLGVWEPGCDLAAPAGVVGLSDLVTLALNYGSTWGTDP